MSDVHRERRRFWSRVLILPSGCWQWTGHIREQNGYGTFAIRRDGKWKHDGAHRWAYTDQIGVIPDSYEVDHLCRMRSCVRPVHLEAVTVQENRRRRDVGYSPDVERSPGVLPAVPPAPPRRVAWDPATHCRNGHLIEAVGRVRNGRLMTCRACRDEQNVRRRKGGAHRDKTECPLGHEYTESNTLTRTRPDGSKQRECKTCVYARNRTNAQKRKRSQPDS